MSQRILTCPQCYNIIVSESIFLLKKALHANCKHSCKKQIFLSASLLRLIIMASAERSLKIMYPVVDKIL